MDERKMSVGAQIEYLRTMQRRYQEANRIAKSHLLDTRDAMTHLGRKHHIGAQIELFGMLTRSCESSALSRYEKRTPIAARSSFGRYYGRLNTGRYPPRRYRPYPVPAGSRARHSNVCAERRSSQVGRPENSYRRSMSRPIRWPSNAAFMPPARQAHLDGSLKRGKYWSSKIINRVNRRSSVRLSIGATRGLGLGHMRTEAFQFE